VQIVGDLFTFIDGSMLLPIVAPPALVSIVDPIGLGVIDDDSPATPNGNFQHDAIQKAGQGQPERDNK
jgi:hypothetical protein